MDSVRFNRVLCELFRYVLLCSQVFIANMQGACSTPSSSESPPNVNDQVSPNTTDAPSSALPSATPSDDGTLLNSLPTGWKPPETSQRDLTTVILALSLVLAGAIIAFMISCVFWRRKRRRQSQKDLEKKLRVKNRAGDESDDEGTETVRQAKVAQKKRAKAATRWRAAIKQSVRRRRTHRVSTSSSVSQISITYNDTDHERPRSVPPSRPISRASSISSSAVSAVGDSSSSTTVIADTSQAPVNSDSIANHEEPPPNIGDVPSHPPAYRSNSTNSDSPLFLSRNNGVASTTEAETPIPGSSNPPSPVSPTDDDEEVRHGEVSYVRIHHAGHVATDDKALLARRAALVSAPPAGDVDSLEHPLALVPGIDDIEESVPDFLPPPSPSNSVPSYSHSSFSMLPPLPSKGKLAAPTYDDYPCTFGRDTDIVGLDPEIGPSAPPFEYPHSAPPFEDSASAPPFDSLAPSAPPSGDDTEVMGPSAPPAWESELGEVTPPHDR